MTKQELMSKPWFELIKEFTNEHGEEWVIYRHTGIYDTIWLAGDETDWKPYQWDGRDIVSKITLSPLERSEVQKLVGKPILLHKTSDGQFFAEDIQD